MKANIWHWRKRKEIKLISTNIRAENSTSFSFFRPGDDSKDITRDGECGKKGVNENGNSKCLSRARKKGE